MLSDRYKPRLKTTAEAEERKEKKERKKERKGKKKRKEKKEEEEEEEEERIPGLRMYVHMTEDHAFGKQIRLP